MAYCVVGITNNISDYPEHIKDTEKYPALVHHVKDELSFFVVNEKTGFYWPAEEFFMQETSVKRFEVLM